MQMTPLRLLILAVIITGVGPVLVRESPVGPASTAFWRLVIALPFAHFQARQAGVGAKIFAGIMLGLVFHFLNKLFSHLGLLNDWPPIAAATIPTLMFLTLAVGMLWWQERR